MDDFDIKPVLESLIFVSESPLRLGTLIELLPELKEEAILEGIQQIKKDFEDSSRGLELVEVAGGYQFRTKPRWGEWVSRLKKVKAVKLSHSALETLAIIAYRQPIIRPAIEKIRGVDSGWVVRTLLEKGLVKMVGRKDIPGRPIVYGTTQAFLELFGLSALSDLPTLKEILPSQTPGEAEKPEPPIAENQSSTSVEPPPTPTLPLEGEGWGGGESGNPGEPLEVDEKPIPEKGEEEI
jgi:segregation and condensation protein B